MPVLRSECVDPRSAYPPPGTLLLAASSDEPVGVVGLRCLEPGQAQVRRLWVRPRARKSGIGRLLMNSAHRHAKDHGVRELLLDVMPSRTNAIAFYEGLGYVATHPRADEIIPMVWMRKLIG